tara:strand:- start:3070 stop:3321 length:252 start_codon:yes stop_codon:yes gene_type:complete
MFPVTVILGSSEDVETTFENLSFLIVFNLYILKIVPFFPTLKPEYIGKWLSKTKIKMIDIKIIGKINMIIPDDIIILIVLLIN